MLIRLTRLSGCLALLAAMQGTACRSTPPPALVPPPLSVPSPARRAPRCLVLDQAAEGLRGPLAAGRTGDFRLENDVLAAVVQGLGGERPGALLDAGPTSTRSDCLRFISPGVGRGHLLSPRYDRVQTAATASMAVLRFVGQDPVNPSVRVITQYSLSRDKGQIAVDTTIVNGGDETLREYRVGDRIDWGTAEPFAPGLGHITAGRATLEWLAASCAGASYGYTRGAGLLTVDFLQQEAATTLGTVEVPAGGRALVHRELAVSEAGHVAGALASVLAGRRGAAGAVRVVVTSPDEDPLPSVEVEARLGGRPYAVGRTGADGSLRLDLPPGVYDLLPRPADRASSPARLEVRDGARVPIHFTAGPPSRLVFEVREENRPGDFPARITILGLDRTPTPRFGPPFSRRPENTILTPTGRGEIPLPPGRYRVVASHGPEFTAQATEVTLRPEAGGSFVAYLRRVVDTRGFIALGHGQRTLASPGCSVSLSDRILADRAQGLAGAVIADLSSSEKPRPALPSAFLVIGGKPRGNEAAGATTQQEDVRHTAAHPEAEVLFNSGSACAVHDGICGAASALRLLDAGPAEETSRRIDERLSLLASGRRVIATAASGRCSLQPDEAGFPRTYVALSGPPHADAVVAALSEGRAIITNGPFLRLTVDGRGPGSAVTPARRGAGRSRDSRVREVTARVVVAAPAWIHLDELVLLVHGKPWGKPLPIPGSADGVRLDQTFQIAVDHDSSIAALVRGSGPPGALGRWAGAPRRAVALSNPIWIVF